MADETPGTPNNSRLYVKVREYAHRIKALRVENESLKTAKTTLETAKTAAETELSSLKAKNDVPTALKRVDELTGELRIIKHRKVFDKLATDSGVKPEALEDLYQLSGYKAETDVIDEAAVKAAIDGQKTARSYLFGAAGETVETPAPGTPPQAQQLPPGPGSNRGGSPITPPQKFTEAQLSDPEFCMKNYAAITAAASESIARGQV